MNNTCREVSIVIVTYNRPNALNRLLQSLLAQQLSGLKTEVIIINNYSKLPIISSPFSRNGRLLGRFKDLKIINSSYNWGPGIRYTIALTSKYQNIMFFDDDIYLIKPNFIRLMLRAFQKIRDVDILTCWADLWVDYSSKKLSLVSVDFYNPVFTDLVQVDYSGTGICLFNKRIIEDERMIENSIKYSFADTAWFPYLPSIIFGTRKYYFPSSGMLDFHKERTKNAICLRPGYDRYI